MQQWVTVSEACQALGVSERTLRRYLSDGKYQSKLHEGRRLILIEMSGTGVSDDTQQILAEKDARIEDLQHEVEYLRQKLDEAEQASQRTDQIIQQMQSDSESSQERSDTIVLQLTRQVETLTQQNQLLLEDNRPKRRWYHRLLVWNNA